MVVSDSLVSPLHPSPMSVLSSALVPSPLLPSLWVLPFFLTWRGWWGLPLLVGS